MKKLILLLGCGIFCLTNQFAAAADNVVDMNVFKAGGTSLATLRATDNGDGTYSLHVVVDAGGGGGGGAATIADGASVTLGAKADSAATTDTGTFSHIALTKRQLQTLTTINTAAGNLDTNLGAKADSAATTDTGTFSLIALFKRLLQDQTLLATASAQSTANTSLATIATNSSNAATHADAIAATPAGENVIGKVAGLAASVAANFTRPADTTAYASGDLVANSTTAGSVTPMSFTVARVNDGTGMVRRVRMKSSSTSLTNASYRVHLYQNDPSASTGITNGDNGAWLTKVAGYLGSVDVMLDKAFSDASQGTGTPEAGSEINFIPTSGAKTIFGLIEARAARTPANAEVLTVTLEVLQN